MAEQLSYTERRLMIDKCLTEVKPLCQRTLSYGHSRSHFDKR
jgi:hypothetical protein